MFFMQILMNNIYVSVLYVLGSELSIQNQILYLK